MKKTIFGIFALMLVGIIATSGLAAAFGAGKMFGEGGETEDIEQAIETNDYDAWKSAVIDTLTEERFEMVVEMHEKNEAMMENQEAKRQAIEDGDYDAYVSAVEYSWHENVLTEEDFDKLVEMHEARQENGGDDPLYNDMSPHGMLGMRHHQPLFG